MLDILNLSLTKMIIKNNNQLKLFNTALISHINKVEF